MDAKTIRRRVAAIIPKTIARLRSSRGSPAAARPIIIALSPDMTRSITTILVKASKSKTSNDAKISINYKMPRFSFIDNS